MELLQDITIFVHVTCASLLVITMIIMQLVVSPALSKVSADERIKAQQVIKARWHPVVDGVIITLTITAIMLMYWRFFQIGQDTFLHYKVSFGIITLVCANIVHFYLRRKKKKLTDEGKLDRVKDFARFGIVLEKTALIFGIITFVMGLLYNHLLF